jgi:hypothetical protein
MKRLIRTIETRTRDGSNQIKIYKIQFIEQERTRTNYQMVYGRNVVSDVDPVRLVGLACQFLNRLVDLG